MAASNTTDMQHDLQSDAPQYTHEYAYPYVSPQPSHVMPPLAASSLQSDVSPIDRQVTRAPRSPPSHRAAPFDPFPMEDEELSDDDDDVYHDSADHVAVSRYPNDSGRRSSAYERAYPPSRALSPPFDLSGHDPPAQHRTTHAFPSPHASATAASRGRPAARYDSPAPPPSGGLSASIIGLPSMGFPRLFAASSASMAASAVTTGPGSAPTSTLPQTASSAHLGHSVSGDQPPHQQKQRMFSHPGELTASTGYRGGPSASILAPDQGHPADTEELPDDDDFLDEQTFEAPAQLSQPLLGGNVHAQIMSSSSRRSGMYAPFEQRHTRAGPSSHSRPLRGAGAPAGREPSEDPEMPWSATRTRLDGDSAAVPLTDKHASSRHSRSHLPGATQSRLNTLFAALLPGVSSSVSLSSTSATVCTYRDLQPRPSVDRGFVMGYTAYCVGFVILSGYHIMQIRAGLDEKGRSSGGYLPATLLTVLTSHAPLILGAATLAIVTGILWLRALRAYLMPTVIAMTAFALPLAGATLGLVLVIVASMHLDHGTRDGGVEGHRMYGFLLGAGLVCLISAGSFVWYFWNNLLGADRAAPGTVPPDESMTSSGRRNGKSRGVTANSHLHAASAIMQLAGDVLRSNASIVSFSIGLMVLHVVWTAAWLWGFTQLFLSYSPSHLIGGGFSGELGGSGVTLWVWAALFLFT
ncbi:hypothetical protein CAUPRSCDRAFT_11408, partial [Caulochytrium protostelioides]